MASVAAQRPPPPSKPGMQRQSSFSSFPSSRSPSTSLRNGRSPQPPVVRGSDRSSDSSIHPSQRSSTLVPSFYGQKSRGPTRKLRSQYPLDSTERHVEYILVAGFDIDRGSVMEHQYPSPITGDEQMLAELMLPDQAHLRESDWTMFFLHKDTTEEDEAREERMERKRLRKEMRESQSGAESSSKGAEDMDEEEDSEEEHQEEDQDDLDGPPLIYVLNLVNTKQDSNAKRGAVVKSMAICTRHSFLHIYKPLLVLALAEYFRAPYPETLASLYNAVNAMDLSPMPRLSFLERQILQSSDQKDMFIEKFERMFQQRMAEGPGRSSSNASDSPSKKPMLKLPRDTHTFQSTVYYNGTPMPVQVPTAIVPETVGQFSIITLINTFSEPHTTTPQPFALHSHLTTSGAYTHPIIVLVNAILTQKRIIFLGHNQRSGDVADFVLAACSLASGGLLRGFTRHAFPYTDLTKIDDLLKVPGFIAGVTNPNFANKPEWWDLLCDVSSGRMKISARIEPAPTNEGVNYFQQPGGHHSGGTSAYSVAGMAAAVGGAPNNPLGIDPTGDNAFMDSIISAITNRHGEQAVRSRWREWILKFTRIAAAFEEVVYGASALYIGAHETDAGAYGVSGHGYIWPDEQSRYRELAGNVHRIEGWRNTRSYYSYIQDLGQLWERRPVRSLDFMHQHDRLMKLKLGYEQSGAILLAFAAAVEDAPESLAGASSKGKQVEDSEVSSQLQEQVAATQYETINQLLTVLPTNGSGLFHISLGLFHPNPEVRSAMVSLLDKIQDHEAGRHYWQGLGRFAKLAFFRVKREVEIMKG
ncbi:spindle pole body interacting protein [Patellaria atrata CBS 101060]|uniref:Spindle pole body interacting protein n=1 Tax=Patellaria atrata CBS 101060 TaxID=1346257 RepID=A0A9P4S9T3_9PEZI|nr:spindle pole body interacting protein [Patellaria atrata CBS 101060]